jgi:hypothetical protein
MYAPIATQASSEPLVQNPASPRWASGSGGHVSGPLVSRAFGMAWTRPLAYPCWPEILRLPRIE